MLNLGIDDIGDSIIAEINLGLISMEGHGKTISYISTHHIIVYFDEHILVINGMFPNLGIAKIDEGEIPVKCRALDQVVHILQIVLIMGIGDPQHFVKEASIRHQIPLQRAVEYFDSPLPPKEYESNDLESLGFLPRTDMWGFTPSYRGWICLFPRSWAPWR